MIRLNAYMIAMDYFTKWVEAIATPKDDAKVVIRFLLGHFSEDDKVWPPYVGHYSAPGLSSTDCVIF